MNKTAHYFYLAFLVIIVAAALISLIILGIDYHQIPLEDHFFHDDHNLFKPIGIFGHGYGVW